MNPPDHSALPSVAIVGMAGRFPGAKSVAEFWRNQLAGVESISHFTTEELEVSDAAAQAKQPNYVRARSILEDIDLFDADFFGIYPREAELMDPQHRLFLECCWEALEDAAYDPFVFPGSIGVFAGCSMPTYFLERLCQSDSFLQSFTGAYQVGNYIEMLGNSPDFLATRVSYKLNLRGPSLTLQTGCSTSLVSVCQACQSLLTYQADMTLAGGVSITLPQKRGYLYQEGGMVSPDGHCRAFDARAQGTVFGSGVAVVLLKRLEDALRDGDQLYALIRGFAVNNDGATKVGFTAPSIDGQAQVIATSQEIAGIVPESIGYVEAHGTGTPLGDPIELAALTQAFRLHTDKKQFCAIGTVKTNVGHLDAAAGVTGLIHAAHVVRHGVLPRTLHFERSNPRFALDQSPFYVNARRTEWKSDQPRRAGVSSFGVGGTNAHVILEQAPSISSEPSLRPAHLLPLSARSSEALDRLCGNLEQHLRTNPDLNLADVAWTLQLGRRHFSHRRTVVARTVSDAVIALSQTDPKRVISDQIPPVHFLFPGQGSQHPNMAREIYETEPVFRDAVNLCCDLLRPHLNVDLRDLLYPSEDSSHKTQFRLKDTIIAQPAIFTIEYALAQLWINWGVRPQAMLGHSIGEFVAACLAGVFSLEDALAVIAARGQMMQQLPAGGMLSVHLPASDVRDRLNGHLSLAAINAPSLCVVAGPLDALDAFASQLESQGVACRRLETSHAFHSQMTDPILDPFTARLRQIPLHPPQTPFVSCVTGTWITESDATDPAYWARHLRAPVEFSAGLRELLQAPNCILLEVGPGTTLTTLARRHNGPTHESSTPVTTVSSLGDSSSREGAAFHLRKAAGSLWLAGLNPNWDALYAGERRHRISLPTYPFERKRFWLESPSANATTFPLSAPENLPPAPGNSISSEEASHVSVNSQPTSTVSSPRPNRNGAISAALIKIFEDLSGARISPADSSATFLEMGFDSLFLTQVTQSLQSQFGLKITFRQLLSEQSTFTALADYITANLPSDTPEQPEPDVTPASAPPAAQVTRIAPRLPSIEVPAVLPPTTAPHPASDSAIERLMREQLQAMNQLIANQLTALTAAKIEQPSAPATLPLTPALSQPITSVPQPTAKDEKPSTPGVASQKEYKPFGPYKPPQKGASGNLTPQQQKYLQSFIDRYTQRTAKSKSSTQQHRRVLADPRVVSGFRSQWKEIVYPILTERSQGSRLWDIDGNEYIDLLSGFGPILFGHRPDFIERAIERQLHEGFEIGPQTPLAGEVAQMFCEITGNERMTFCNTGSEAVIAALRVARTVTARSKVVLFSGSYHGMFDEVLVKGPKSSAGSSAPSASAKMSFPIAPGIPRESVGNVIVLEYGAPESLDWIRSHAHELAAVLVEPVQSRHPDLQPVEFLREIRAITEKSGAALIFDEVVTGFRVHPGGCQALFDIRADLATYGKALAGGMPIGVLAGKAAFMDALDGGAWQFGDDSYPSVGVTFFAGTFVRHPLTLAAAKAVLEYFKEQGPQLQKRLNTRAAALVRSLNDLLTEAGVPVHIENFASIFYFSFPNDLPLGSLLYCHLRQKGIFLLEGFPCFLTTAHTDADIEKVIRAFRDSIAEMQAGGLLPGRQPSIAPSDARRSIPAPAPALAPTQPEIISIAASTPSEAPLTESQLEIWFSAQLSDQASCAFNESFTLEMRGPLDEPALRASLQDLVNRHDALRAIILPDRLSLRFAPHLSLSLSTEDLSSQPPAQRQILLDNAKHHEAVTSFDLINGPLVRARLFRLEPDHHALIFTSHHIICDGWSTNVLLDELAKLYSARRTGAAAQLPQPLQFSEFVHAQAQNPKSPETNDALAYWLRQFAQLPPVLELPTDRPRPAMKSFKGETCRARIDAATLKHVKQTGARHGCTLFASLFTGFALLLRRLTSQDDIVIGIPAAGQSLLDNSNFVGHCVNFLPLRVQFADNQPVSQLLQSAKRTLLDAYEHQRCTYGTLVRELKLRRDPSRLPLVEVQFNLEKVGAGASFSGLQTAVDPNPKAAVNFDLFLNVVESPDGLLVDCDYNSDLFDSDTIARWLTHFETLLNGIANDTAQSADRLPILDDASLQQILVDWNATASDYPRDACVHQLIELQAQRTPDALAACFADQTLTYAQLERRANQLARHLIKVGVTPGSMVAISVERSLEMLVSLLAIWKAGAAYIPLDPGYPRERLSYILQQTSTPILITQSNLVSRLPVFDTRLICLDRDAVLVARELQTAPNLPCDSQSNAYVIFTSGSTGKPKGVEVTHRNVVNLLCSMREQPGLTPQDRLLAVTTLSFDIAGLELFLPLITGACVILAAREHCVDGRRLLKLMKDSAVTVVQATPATWRLLLEAGWTGTPGLKILCGGEALPRDLANDLVSRGELWNMYGPTETTIWSATSRVEEGQGPVAIGPPIRNTQFYVLDKLAQPQPIGVPGELYIGGDGVARGYFQQPQMTAERFVPNPFANNPAARLYKTGDSVRYRPDGSLEFLGRLDNQVKIRGFRIELAEIEAVLARHPAVQECVVVPQEEEPGLKRLVAYLVPRDSREPAADELRKWIAGSLPDYMVPSIFAALPALPHTPNGKIDRKALSSLESSRPAIRKLSVAPQTSVEKQLADICAEVLHLDQISIADSLFDLGADSLHLFQIAARAARAGLALAPQEIMRLRTIAALAAEIDTLPPSPPSRTSKSPQTIAPVSREPYQLTSAPQAT
jgi:amino acid adenylation domain-containing protein